MEKESTINKLTAIYAGMPNDRVRAGYEQLSQASANLINWINILIEAMPDDLKYDKGLVHTTGKELKEMAARAAKWYSEKYRIFSDSFID